MKKLLPTSTAGSLPKPSWLAQPEQLWSPWKLQDQELVDGKLDAQASNLNFRGSYTTYGINAILLENYTNSGAPRVQSRNFDNFVVSRTRIGCASPATTPNPPTNVHSN